MASDPSASGGSIFGGNFGGGSISGVGSNIGGAVADIFAAQGYKYKEQGALLEKGMYEESASWARQNEQYTEISSAIQQMQQQRKVEMAMGGTRAAVAGAGFEAAGSALDILADSAQQGSLAHQVLEFQGHITEAGYEEQAKALDSQAQAAQIAADAAKTAQTGSWIGAAIKGATAVAEVGMMVASDRRLKEDIVPVGTLYDGQTVYRFRYKGEATVRIGLIAQEVEEFYPQAIGQIQGLKFVDYGAATEAAARHAS